jgi:Flp pilus assembly protein TadB
VTQPSGARQPGRYVAAGVTYLLLSGVVYVLWIVLHWFLLLLLAVPTFVGAVVLLSVGLPRLRRARAAARRAHGQSVAERPVGMRES